MIVKFFRLANWFLTIVVTISTILAFFRFEIEVREVWRALDACVASAIIVWGGVDAILKLWICFFGGLVFLLIGSDVITHQVGWVWICYVEILAGFGNRIKEESSWTLVRRDQLAHVCLCVIGVAWRADGNGGGLAKIGLGVVAEIFWAGFALLFDGI